MLPLITNFPFRAVHLHPPATAIVTGCIPPLVLRGEMVHVILFHRHDLSLFIAL
jgi:hypothetical protein